MWMQRPSTPAWPDPAWCWLMQRMIQIIRAGAEMLLIARDPGGWAWRSSREPAGASLRGWGLAVLRCRAQAAAWGSGGLGRCCWLCCPPHVAQSLQKSLAPGGGERHALIFFLSPFTLSPGAGEGWKGEMQPRGRRDACPWDEYPRDYPNP